jgi:hypothetical protein
MISGKFLLGYDYLQARMRAQLYLPEVQASAHAGAGSSTSLVTSVFLGANALTELAVGLACGL